MWKYNKYNLGDFISHINSKSLEFQVSNIHKSEPDTKGEYLYRCMVTHGHLDELGKEFKYHESDVSFIRKATKQELKILLDNVIEDEDYILAQHLKNQIDKLK